MSLRDLNRLACRLFGQASVTEDLLSVRIGEQDFPLPGGTQLATGTALLYAKEYGPPALLETVAVCRHPGDGAYIAVAFHQLAHFHFRFVSGGIGRRTARPFLYARMLCSAIPDDARFGHSCRHGEGPHEILVCITQVANARPLYQRLRALADDEQRLRQEIYHPTLPPRHPREAGESSQG